MWVWHRGPVLRLWDSTVWWACPQSPVTFEPGQALLWAWHGVKDEAMAVTVAEHTTGIVWEARREKGCEVGVTVVRWWCHTHTGNEVSSWVGRVVERLGSLWSCGGSAVLVGLFVDFRLPVNTWLGVSVLEAQDGGAVGVAWPFPSWLASSPLRALIKHIRL